MIGGKNLTGSRNGYGRKRGTFFGDVLVHLTREEAHHHRVARHRPARLEAHHRAARLDGAHRSVQDEGQQDRQIL